MERSVDDAQVWDDVTDWKDDLDLSLEPPEVARPRRRRSPLLFVLAAVAFLMMLGLGLLGAIVLGGAAVAVAMLLLAPRVAPPPELPVVSEPVIEIVAPLAVDAPRGAPAAPAKERPAAPPVAPVAPAAPGVDANMIVMPDPGFKSVPVDRALRKLHEKAGRGEMGAVGGH